MPNNITNKLVLNGSNELIESIIDLTNGEYSFTLTKTIPEPIVKDENWDWYEWRCENWGTKWNVYDISITKISDTQIKLDFLTAWNPPHKWFETIGKRFSNLTLRLSWVDEDFPRSGLLEAKEGLVTNNYYGYGLEAEEFIKNEFPNEYSFYNEIRGIENKN